jgi:hypothetical protein
MWMPLQPHLRQAEVSSCTSNPSTATAPSLCRSRAFSESAVTWPGTRVAGRRLITGTLSKPPTSDRASALSRCASHSSLGVYVQCGMRYTRFVGLGHVGPPAAAAFAAVGLTMLVRPTPHTLTALCWVGFPPIIPKGDWGRQCTRGQPLRNRVAEHAACLWPIRFVGRHRSGAGRN